MNSVQVWNTLKWFGVVCFSVATMIMLNPNVAATSITPWALYLTGNIIWLVSSFRSDWALFGLSSFYFTWDIMLVISRYYPDFFNFAQPIINSLEVLP